MNKRTCFETVSRYMTEPIRQAMLRMLDQDRAGLTELSLYSGRPPAFVYPGKVRFLTISGELVSSGRTAGLLNVSSEDIAETVSALAHHSLHSCERELHHGYFVLPGGIRVGVAGTYSSSGVLKDWNALNFRFAAEHRGCADTIFPLITNGGSILICGGVNSGKTTVLRELCRLCGDIFKTSLIDERGEISAISGGEPKFDTGLLTSILSGCTRAQGITAAVRTLAPTMIFTDEIASCEEAAAVVDGAGCGIRFAATTHAHDMNDICSRPVTSYLLESGVFSHVVFLAGSLFPGKIREIRSINNAVQT